MAVNVTVRDIVNFPGGTAKTVTVDIIQIVPVAGNPEGDEIWVSSSTTTATASGGGSIENIFKNEMKRGFLKSSGLVSGLVNIPSSAGFKVAIDEDSVSAGVDIVLDSADNRLLGDIAQDIENKIQAEAVIGGGGAKIGNLSYLNCQVRFVNSKFQIESGTLSDTYTGDGKSSVEIDAPDSGVDIRATLGLDITISSALLAARQIVESDLIVAYSSGDILEVTSTAGLSAGAVIKILDDTNSQNVVLSGVGIAGGLPGSQMRFVTASGVTTGLETSYAIGSVVRLLHEVDVADPVSATDTVDELYRFQIDSLVNQIDFSA